MFHFTVQQLNKTESGQNSSSKDCDIGNDSVVPENANSVENCDNSDIVCDGAETTQASDGGQGDIKPKRNAITNRPNTAKVGPEI